uniref:INO80 complex subunit C n=1 Tax=Gallus gallus TaxID=9031 RepID=A0A8V0XTT9_CHICK
MASLIPAATSSPAGAPSRSKKRPASPGTGSGPAKKKKVAASSGSQSAGGEVVNENKFLNTDSSTGSVETAVKPLPFKDPNFIHSSIGGAAAGKKNRTWKNLKQILASERALPWQLNDPSYFSIDAPPSFKPAKKYSDISGLPDLNRCQGSLNTLSCQLAPITPLPNCGVCTGPHHSQLCFVTVKAGGP